MPYLPALSPLGELFNNEIERQVSREVRSVPAHGAVAAAHQEIERATAEQGSDASSARR